MQETVVAAGIHMGRLADVGGIGAVAVAEEPAGRYRIAAQRDFPAGLVSRVQVQLPSQEAELGVDVADLVVTPAGAVDVVIDDRRGVVGIGIAWRHRVGVAGVDERFAGDHRDEVGQCVGKTSAAIDRYVPGSVGQGRGHLGDAVDHAGRSLGKGAVGPAVGNVAAFDVQLRVLSDLAGGQVDLPGDLVDRHIDPVGGISVAVDGIGGAAAEVQRCYRLPPRIQCYAAAGRAGNTDEVDGIGQVGGDQQHLSHFELLGLFGPGGLDRGRGLADPDGLAGAVQP